MGVYHFAGLGKSPGAVTSGLAYLKHERASSFRDGKIVEAVVVFTSPEVGSGEEPALPVVWNEYGKRHPARSSPQLPAGALDIVGNFLEREVPGSAFYCVETNVNDFSVCFEAVARVLLHFHPPGGVGKHIWMNLTGGTNVLNMALMQAAYLNGFVPELYYTFVANLPEDGGYLQPFSNDPNEFDFREIFVLPTTFDQRYRYLLEELQQLREGVWIDKRTLLGRLKHNHAEFQKLKLEEFVRNYLNAYVGIDRRGTRETGQEDAVRLSPEGAKVLELLGLDWFRALLDRTTWRERLEEGDHGSFRFYRWPGRGEA